MNRKIAGEMEASRWRQLLVSWRVTQIPPAWTYSERSNCGHYSLMIWCHDHWALMSLGCDTCLEGLSPITVNKNVFKTKMFSTNVGTIGWRWMEIQWFKPSNQNCQLFGEMKWGILIFADVINSRHHEQYVSAKSYSVDVLSLCINPIRVGQVKHAPFLLDSTH